MRRLITKLSLIASFIGLVLSSGPAIAEPHNAPIRLKATQFRPSLNERPDISAALALTEPEAGRECYYLVQFSGPIRAPWKEALTGHGATILSYIPEFAFKVHMTPAVAEQVRSMENVVSVATFHPAYKLSPDLVRDGQRIYTVRLEKNADPDQTARAIRDTGIQVLKHTDGHYTVRGRMDQLEAVARIAQVAWIENMTPYELHNEYGAGDIMSTEFVNNSKGYDGSTQIVAVADTGLGDGTVEGAHRDIPADRIVAIHNWPGESVPGESTVTDDGARDVVDGHGTHVAASVLSDGAQADKGEDIGLGDGEGRGAAPAARLVFQALQNYVEYDDPEREEGYKFNGLPSDLNDLFQQAYDDEARIHCNSWGAPVNGDYNANAVETDTFMWNNPDMLVTFSAGNRGIDRDADGIVDNDSMSSPATAKNTLSVGASENDRQGAYHCDDNLTYVDASERSCQSLGGINNIFTWGEGSWSVKFPVNPLADDPSTGNAEQMAAFSGRGPTDDGRIKPDVVAPGSWILSAYSDMFQEGYDNSSNPQTDEWQYDGYGFPLNRYYKYYGGTSMANPLAAGVAALVRDYYQKAHSHAASAALVKATLINSAVDMLDENNDGANDNDYPIPNNHEGWGRVDAEAATDEKRLFEDVTDGLDTDETAFFEYAPGTDGLPFKVSLVWTDYPASPSAGRALVNDLNLVVTAPDGTQYLGNNFSGGWSTTGGSADNINNVECVYIESAAAGTWTVQVSGYNVPYVPQPYALVVDISPTHVLESEDFESGMGNWANVTIDDTHDWTRNSGGTPSNRTGPTGGAGGSTRYMYMETSSRYAYNSGDSAILEGPEIAGSDRSLSFYYHMYGSTMGTLSVDVYSDGSWINDVWRMSGEQHSAGSAAYTRATVDLSSYNGTIKIRYRGTAAGGWRGDMAVDDVMITGVTDDSTPPTAEITRPVHGATVNGRVNVTADASTSATQVQFFINGTSIGLDREAPYAVSWDTTAESDGNYTLIATATDAKGLTSDSPQVVVTVDNASAPANPGNLSAMAGNGAVSLDWNDNSESDLAGYRVYRSTTSDSNYTQITSGVSSSAYTDNSANNGTTYYYVVTAVDTNNNESGYSNEASATPTASSATEHVGDLDGRGDPLFYTIWSANVTIEVHDNNDEPVSGATVSGSWSSQSGSSECTTGNDGRCSVSSNYIWFDSSTTFTVNNVSHPTLTYQSADNHDTDGDSNGTEISIFRP